MSSKTHFQLTCVSAIALLLGLSACGQQNKTEGKSPETEEPWSTSETHNDIDELPVNVGSNNAGGGVGTSTPTPQPAVPSINNSPELKAYIKGLNYNPKILLAETTGAGEVIKLDPTREEGSGNVIVCTREQITEKENFEQISILQPTEGVIYPGALIYGDGTLRDGMPRQLTELPRSPISLRLDLPGLGREGSFTIENPTAGKYQGYLNEALQAWVSGPAFEDGYVNAARSKYDAETLYSREQISLALDVSAEWSSGSADVAAAFKSDTSKHVVVAVFKQVFYTVTYDAPNSPEQAFAGSVTKAEAEAVFSAENPPAYVSSVNYGRVIMLRMETDKSITNVDAKAAFEYGKAKATNIAVEVNAEYDRILQQSKISVFTLGGNAENAVDTIDVGSPKDLAPIIKGKNAVYSASNPGVPIAYTVKYLKDNRVGKLGSTAEYTRTDCKELKNFRLKVIHAGAFVGHFDVSWGGPDPQNYQEHGKTAGFQRIYEIPGDSTNIRLKIQNDTGLVWDPQRPIINRELTPAELKEPLCIVVKGTTLGSFHEKTTCS